MKTRMENLLFSAVQNSLQMNFEGDRLQHLLNVATQYPRSVANLNDIVRSLMKEVTTYDLRNSEKRVIVTTIVTHVIPGFQTERDSVHWNLVGNVIDTFYNLSQNEHVFHNQGNLSVPGVAELDPMVNRVTVRLNFAIDVNVVNHLVTSARSYELTLVTLPLVLRSLMQTLTNIRLSTLLPRHREDLVVALIEELIISQVAAELRPPFVESARALVRTYYVLSKNAPLFSQMATATCMCF